MGQSLGQGSGYWVEPGPKIRVLGRAWAKDQGTGQSLGQRSGYWVEPEAGVMVLCRAWVRGQDIGQSLGPADGPADFLATIK